MRSIKDSNDIMGHAGLGCIWAQFIICRVSIVGVAMIFFSSKLTVFFVNFVVLWTSNYSCYIL